MFEDVNKNKANLNQGGGDISPTQSQPQSQSAPTPPTQPPRADGGVEDIFSGEVEASPQVGVGFPRTEKPPIFQPKAPTPPGNLNQAEVKEELDIKKYMIFGLIILLVAVVLSGGWYGFNKFFKDANIGTFFLSDEGSEQTEDTEVSDETEITEDIIEENEITEDNEPIVITPQDLDTDQDGLTDEEEMALGTNINSVDSDDDGLFDREEVEVYETNPLNSDTDSDGYLDGAEVKAGYNPKGDGRLFEIKK